MSEPLTVPAFVVPALGARILVANLPLFSILTIVPLLAAGLWFLCGHGPRRRRAYQRAQQLLDREAWERALNEVQRLQRLGQLSPSWRDRARTAEGNCRRVAATVAMREQRFEEGLAHYRQAAPLLGLEETECRRLVVEEMLAEARRRFASSTSSETGPIQELIDRTLRIQAACPEALFWQGLCHAREGQIDRALTALQAARAGEGKPFIDPPLYLGALHLKAGRVQEALRHLADANRIDPECPLVSWQLGQAIVAMGDNDGLAVRALQRTLGPRGLPRWLKAPERLWKEALPGPVRSLVERLAAIHTYVCPVLGNDVAGMVRQGQLALAQAQYRLGHFPEAVQLYQTVLQDCPPTAPVLRGLGLALARLGRHDEAFKHLRTAHEQEEPKNHLTAGYLALCGARGKPVQAEDRPRNIGWAIRLLSRFDVRGDPEWATLNSAVFAEARSAGLALTVDDQARLCETLASVKATDPAAAAAYDHLAATFPEALPAEQAWLCCRAIQEHGLRTGHELDLFARTFAAPDPAREYFQRQGWDFKELEYTYLEHWAACRPGKFPEVLGPDYPRRGQELLLARSHRQEQAGQWEQALASAGVLLLLAPANGIAHDRLACLHYRRGDLDQAAEFLRRWQALEPGNFWPLIRVAIVEQQRHQGAACSDALSQALALAQGKTRAALAFLGARLSLEDRRYDEAQALLQDCLREDPDHEEALWCLAAVRSLQGDRASLADQAGRMRRPKVVDACFHYLAAVCHLAAEEHEEALAACQRLAANPALALDSAYLVGWSHWRRGDARAAALELAKVESAGDCPSAGHARALLAKIHFERGDYDQAITYWVNLDPLPRRDWQLEEPLRETLFLNGLLKCQAGQFHQAALLFREADQRGSRRPELAALRIMALVQAGQQVLGDPGKDFATANAGIKAPLLTLLDEAVQAGCQDARVVYLLAMAYKRQGQAATARDCLRRIAFPEAQVFFQIGVLSLRDKLLAEAEGAFAEALRMEPFFFEACANLLLTHLSQGQVEQAAALAPRAYQLALLPEAQKFFGLIQALLETLLPVPGENLPLKRLTVIAAQHEERLLHWIRGLGHLETSLALLKVLVTARPTSAAVQQAYLEAGLLQAKRSLDHCDWTRAEQLLAPLLGMRVAASRPVQAALSNLLGCCACLGQEFGTGVIHFNTALKMASSDPFLIQNLALAYEFQNQGDHAAPHWDRYLENLGSRMPAPPGQAGYRERLVFETLNRLATRSSEKEKWPAALGYLQRAQQLQPQDADILERLFHLYQQLRRPEDARRALRQLRTQRPDLPQFDLYEVDLLPMKTLEDLDKVLFEIDRVLRKHPNDVRVEERATSMIGNGITFMTRLHELLNEQLDKTMKQLERGSRYEIDWAEIHDYVADLHSQFKRLKRLANKHLPTIINEQQRRTIREMERRLEHDIEVCQSLGS